MNKYGFVRVAAATPRVCLGDPQSNIKQIESLADQAAQGGAAIFLTPELSITGYTIADLVAQPTLLQEALKSLKNYVAHDAQKENSMVSILGMPLALDDQIFNMAVVVSNGKVVGMVPKSYPPNYREFYEGRWYAPAKQLRSTEVRLFGQTVPVGTDLLFNVSSAGAPLCTFGIEICEDLFVADQPSTHAALAGATLLLNPSASNELISKAAYRKELVKNSSGRTISAYAYTSAGVTESTTDVVFSGHAVIAENGAVIAESKRFNRDNTLTIADVDIQRLKRERFATTSFGQNASANPKQYRTVRMDASPLQTNTLERYISKTPFVPSNPETLEENCDEILNICAHGLATRLENAKINGVYIGISGGLDSTLALLVTARAFDLLKWNRKNIHAFTMPGYGTTERTRTNAHKLCEALQINLNERPIVTATDEVLRAGGHEPCRNCLMCENAQARVRTQILMNQGFTVGTGDLSEMALGWCTYAGDQTSMYHVNAGVPKTLVKFVIDFVAQKDYFGKNASTILRDIIDTPISPELLPADKEGNIVQKTEDLIGPYILHDFFLFHMIRNGYSPSKIVMLAHAAFQKEYSRNEIVKWLEEFYTRFFRAQFKRSGSPDGPKVGTVSLSQRGDWRMPSDANGKLWIQQTQKLKTTD